MAEFLVNDFWCLCSSGVVFAVTTGVYPNSEGITNKPTGHEDSPSLEFLVSCSDLTIWTPGPVFRLERTVTTPWGTQTVSPYRTGPLSLACPTLVIRSEVFSVMGSLRLTRTVFHFLERSLVSANLRCPSYPSGYFVPNGIRRIVADTAPNHRRHVDLLFPGLCSRSQCEKSACRTNIISDPGRHLFLTAWGGSPFSRFGAVG